MSEGLSEKDVAAIRHGVESPSEQFNYASREEMLEDFSRKLLADRDAHLARAKEASDLILRVVEGKLECGCEDHRNDALLAALSLLERTK